MPARQQLCLAGFIPGRKPRQSPERGFLEVNQRAVDFDYPCILFREPILLPRGISIEKHLAGMTGVTVDDMKRPAE